MTPVNRTTPQFADLLSRALTEPGVVSRAYAAFHDYSLGKPSGAASKRLMPSPSVVGSCRRSLIAGTRTTWRAKSRRRSGPGNPKSGKRSSEQ